MYANSMVFNGMEMHVDAFGSRGNVSRARYGEIKLSPPKVGDFLRLHMVVNCKA